MRVAGRYESLLQARFPPACVHDRTLGNANPKMHWFCTENVKSMARGSVFHYKPCYHVDLPWLIVALSPDQMARTEDCGFRKVVIV